MRCGTTIACEGCPFTGVYLADAAEKLGGLAVCFKGLAPREANILAVVNMLDDDELRGIFVSDVSAFETLIDTIEHITLNNCDEGEL